MEKRTITLSETQKKELEHLRDHDRRPYLRERASALLKIHAGQSAYKVARYGLLKPRDPDTVYSWLERYEQTGVEGLVMKERRKRYVPP